MTKLKYIIALLFVAGGIFTSCTEDEMYGPTLSSGDGSLTLQLSVPDPIVVQPETRAGVSDFNTISDLNVVVAEGSGDEATIKQIYYVKGNNITSSSSSTTGVTADLTADKPYIHFDKDAYPGTNIYVVGNYGSMITGVSTVNDVKSIQQHTYNNTGVVNGSYLFGTAEAESGTDEHGGALMKVELKRTVAMVTLVIDGTGLNPNVRITPTAVSLCNVPTSCYVGKDNVDLEANETNFTTGETKQANMMNLEPISGEQNGIKKTGKHFSTTAYDDEDVFPFFLFENLHSKGDEFGASDAEDSGKNRRPANVENNWNAIENGAKNCPYIKVEADYYYMESGKEVAGKVIFKFFLGEDVTTNFDVKRNTYYKVTLQLEDYVIKEDGHSVEPDGTFTINNDNVSWRVDTELSPVTMLTGDVNINASGDFFFIDLEGRKDVEWRLSSTGDGGMPFLWAYGSVYGSDPMWGSLSNTDVSGSTIPEEGILIYCDAWYDGEFSESKSIDVTLQIRENGNWINVQTITVTQYAPIIVKLPRNADLPEGLQAYAGKTLWLDRVDRTAMPWGFENTAFATTNATNGYENAYAIADNQTYRKVAESYMPWGKGNGGSAMVYGICLNNFGNNTPTGTPESVINNADFPTSSYLKSQYTNLQPVWTLPTVAGWQVIEKYAKEEIEASGFPIYPFNEYWTSNVVAADNKQVQSDGTEYAYYYRYGSGFDKIEQGQSYPYYRPRTNSLRFRCVAIINS